MGTIRNASVITWEITDDVVLKNLTGYRDFENRDALGLSGLPYQILDVRIPEIGHEWIDELRLQDDLDPAVFLAWLQHRHDRRIQDPPGRGDVPILIESQ
jgi:hypothetical protein